MIPTVFLRPFLFRSSRLLSSQNCESNRCLACLACSKLFQCKELLLAFYSFRFNIVLCKTAEWFRIGCSFEAFLASRFACLLPGISEYHGIDSKDL